ncbi:hypothetical protein B0H17DRAFT_13434 [Mycena rosella]|uniref:Uncharacterized protein n=1 Tax=Mycena rosella TaxID=1033263 RepID=A0AAD7GSV2_MYCRO|nr:hypothetical protein B0H17DRAFT_13434 [Mycena rosella]
MLVGLRCGNSQDCASLPFLPVPRFPPFLPFLPFLPCLPSFPFPSLPPCPPPPVKIHADATRPQVPEDLDRDGRAADVEPRAKAQEFWGRRRWGVRARRHLISGQSARLARCVVRSRPPFLCLHGTACLAAHVQITIACSCRQNARESAGRRACAAVRVLALSKVRASPTRVGGGPCAERLRILPPSVPRSLYLIYNTLRLRLTLLA